MGNKSDYTSRPSLEEFGGWYNLGYERPDGIPVLHSQPHVPEFEHGEFFQLWMEEHAWFEGLVPISALKPFDPIAEAPMYVKSDADDRTLDVFANPDYLTLDVIKRIQREFLGRHPFWRVVIAADHPSCCMIIYPDAIRFGNLPLDIDDRDAFREVNARAAALRDASERPMRARIDFLKQRLPIAVRAIGEEPFSIVAVFDTNRDHPDRLTVCLVSRCDTNGTDLQISGPAGVDNSFMSKGYDFNVDRSGVFVSDEAPDTAVAFRIRFWHPPADYRGPLTIVNRDTGEQYPYDLKSENITRLGPQT
jgi:hypothetical protein